MGYITPTKTTVDPVIAVDFDGTLCEHEFPGIGKVKAGAKEALMMFKALGYTIVIWSCRSCHWNYDVFGGDPSQPVLEREKIKDMVAFLQREGIPYDIIDDGSKGKPLADFYIDDKAIRFQNNWPEIAHAVHNYQYGKAQQAQAAQVNQAQSAARALSTNQR